MKPSHLLSMGLVVIGIGLFTSSTLATSSQQTRHIHVRTADAERFEMTVILRHDPTKTQDEIQAHLEKTKFHETFPPKDVKIVSWTSVMGLGQVIVLDLPARSLPEVNMAFERGARGAFKTEFYPSYDLVPELEKLRGEPLPRPDWWVAPRR